MEQVVFIDRETGESVFECLDQERFNPLVPEDEVSNAETGEPEINVNNVTTRRKITFQVQSYFIYFFKLNKLI